MQNYKFILLFTLGLIIGVGGGYLYKYQWDRVAPVEAEVHVHSDLLVYINDEQLRFTDEKYQSKAGHVLHKDFHFHDGKDDVIHRHAEDLTLADFFSSLGFTLTNDRLVTDDGREFVSNEKEKLQLYVNGTERSDIISYVPQDSDRILIYFGNTNNPNLPTYLGDISDRACIYSYTCPERGTPPPEECGLTCEI